MKLRIATLLSLALLLLNSHVYSQTFNEWFKQKKTQKEYLLKQIAKLQVQIGYVRKGYNIAREGLNLIGDIKNGDFHLHKDYFNHLARVSPTVKKYQRIVMITAEYGALCAAWAREFPSFRVSGLLTTKDVNDLRSAYDRILREADADLRHLQDIITDYTLQMTDKERLDQIDQVYASTVKKRSIVTSLLQATNGLVTNRERSRHDMQALQQLSPQ